MENDITLDQVNNAINVIENHHIKRDYQKLDEVLPLALALLKYKAADMEAEQSRTKYYIPSWVDMLLSRLADSKDPLDNMDYAIYLSLASHLSAEDFKQANSALFGFKVKYMSAEEVQDLITAIKTYFKLI